MKRTAIKKRPLSDTTLASLEPEDKDYRELDSNGLYFLVQKKGNKSWQLRYKKPDGKWSWMGLGAYPAISGALARKKANEILNKLSNGEMIETKADIRKQATEQKALLTLTDYTQKAN